MMFLDRLVSMIDDGKYDTFGPEFARIIKALVANDQIGSLGLPAVDITKLHRSSKTKSGFIGVYANGKGFRAVGKGSGVGGNIRTTDVNIGTYPTAEQAAWARLLHYKRHKLPYGELEEQLEYWRRQYPDLSDAELVSATAANPSGRGNLGELFERDGMAPSEQHPQDASIKPLGGVDESLFGNDV